MALRPAPPIVAVAVCAGLAACTGTGSAGPGTPAGAPSRPARSSVRASTPAPVPRVSATRARWVLPQARSREVAVPAGGDLLVAGGLSAARVSTDTVWLLDPAGGRVRSTGRLVSAVHDATAFGLGGRLFLAGGGAATTVDVVQRLATAGPASTAGRLPRPRSDLTSTTLDGVAYVLGGFDGVRALPDVLATRDGRHYSVVARLPVTVRYAAVAAVAGRLWVFGGEHDGVGTAVVQQVDPATGRARVVGRLPTALAHEAVFVARGAVWLAGGRDHARLVRTVSRWDPATGRATRVGRLPYAVADAAAALVDGVGYLLGGETPEPTRSVLRLAFDG